MKNLLEHLNTNLSNLKFYCERAIEDGYDMLEADTIVHDGWENHYNVDAEISDMVASYESFKNFYAAMRVEMDEIAATYALVHRVIEGE